MYQKYLNGVFAKCKTGDASERSYYTVLENLLKDYKNTEVLVEGKNSNLDIPDFKVQTQKELLVGYIEAKDVGRDLDKLTKGEQEQIQRYLNEYPKLIVTNFIEFRLYENAELVDSVVISRSVTLKIGAPALDNEGRFKGLLERFFSTTIPKIYSSKRLSEFLAHKTRVLRDLIREEIDLTDDIETNTENLLETFRKTLKPDMTPDRFSDMYAQTITFGLFIARINSDSQEFNRYTAHTLIPQTIPLLKKIFWVLSGQDVPQHIEWQVDEVAEILANTDIEKITEEFFKHGKGKDPIIHFYETFLAKYDPKQREELGVYYTPKPVVSYITRSLHKLLKKHFSKSDGFADKSVIVLDPAAGTLTFPAEAITIAKEEFVRKHGDGGWNQLVKEHVLKNFYAFELLIAPYAVGHLKISLLLKELGYQMKGKDRFELYLTNTLDMSKFKPQQEILAKEISAESEKAYEIKDKVPVLVVMGNPPYSGHSSNIGEWIMNQIEDYKQIDGESLGERNPKWLNDDYVKFFRFAQWKIDKTGQGILGFITNHAWLDNPTFRGMRYSLMKTFDEIYILNLHGSTLKKEKVPEGVQKKERIDAMDEGVFGIKPGTAITIGVKLPKTQSKKGIYYSELWGSQKRKFRWLEKNDSENVKWQRITPSEPSYFFLSRDEKGWNKYKNFIKITDIFPLNSIGIQTHRDGFVINFEESELKRRLRMFLDRNLPDQLIKDTFKLKDTKAWNVAEKRKASRLGDDWESEIVDILYRPFDIRKIFYNKEFVDRPRLSVMKNMLKSEDNLLMLVPRRVGRKWRHCFVANLLSVDVAISTGSREANQTFPLYVYNNSNQQGLLEEENARSYNLDWDVLPDWMSTIQPFDSPATDRFIQPAAAIFYYIYAILYSSTYREKYQEFLKSDFPRIPFTADYNLLKALAVNGEHLVDLHLLKSKILEKPVSQFQGKGDSRVEKRKYDPRTKSIYINDTQYFNKVEPHVWEYLIGGYQVLDRWLKDRKGKVLSTDDQLHYKKVITALSETIEVQKRIDKLYPKVEKKLA